MRKTLSNSTHKIVLIILAILAATALVISGVAYGASVSFQVNIKYPYEAGTGHFVFDGGNYNSTHALTAGQTSLTTKINRINYENHKVEKYDLLIFLANGNATLGNQTGETASTGETVSISSGKCILFRNQVFGASNTKEITVNFTGVATNQVANMVVINSDSANRYIKNFFQLQMLNNESLHNTDYDAEISAGKQPYYKNVYILDNLVVEHEFAINYPCYINLLYSEIKLGAPLAITHHDKGAYEIEKITGKINNDDFMFTINSPNAYFRTDISDGSFVDSLVTNATNFVKNSNNVDFNDAANSALLDALLADAAGYILQYLPSQLFDDIILPRGYHQYGVQFYYAMSDETALNKSGNVTRAADTKDVTVGITVAYGAGTLGEVTLAAAKTCSVIGTSPAAFTNGLAQSFQEFHTKSGIKTSEGSVILKQPLAVIEFVSDYIAASGYNKDFALNLSNTGNLFFKQSGTIANELTFSYEAASLRYNVAVGVHAAVPIDSVFITLNPQEWLLDKATEKLTVTSVGESADVAISLEGITLEQQHAYLERFIETVYLSSATDAVDVLRVDTVNGGIYLGNKQAEPLIPYTFGYDNVVYDFYLVNKTDLAALKQGTLTLAELVQVGVNYNEYFNLDVPGSITPKADRILTISDTKELILHMSFVGGSAVDYNTYRPVIIPSGGLGGSDFIEYIKGNTYGPYFDNLPDGKLIDSVADSAGVSGSAYKFTVDTKGVNLHMTIGTVGVESFCTMVKTKDYYQIDIDVENIPSHNTTIRVEVVFYTTNIAAPISTQNYSFIIPGVYRVGKDFGDQSIYNYIRDYKVNGEFVFESYGNYLLVDGAVADCEVLDCSLVNLTDKTAADTIDIRGIELLVNVKKLIFDGCKLASLAPFNAYTTHNIQQLSLANCSITDDMLQAQSLYKLNTLTKLNLDGNYISSFVDANGKPLIYRTVRDLSANNQLNGVLKNLESLSQMHNLATLAIKGNSIATFAPLANLGALKTVYLGGNTATEFSGKVSADTNIYYGTDGQINIPIFVGLIGKGVAVYKNDVAPLAIGTDISQDAYLGSLVLNAIVTLGKQFSNIIFPTEAIEYTDVVGGTVTAGATFALTTKYIILNNNAEITHPTNNNGTISVGANADLFNGKRLNLIAGITYNGTTVYKEFTFTFAK